MTKPLLTIAIPTFNRAACLRELLGTLADQLKDESRVELLISDNASPDETPPVVQEFADRGVAIRCIRNAENIGPDANFLQCFQQARGKYFWLFSDDDLVAPGGIAKIVSYCESGDYDLMWVSSYGFHGTHTPAPLKAGHDAIDLSDVHAYVKRVHIFFSFISGNIINRDTVLAEGTKRFETLVGSSLMQLAWAYTALNRFSRGLYIREKIIAVRANNTGGYKLFQVFGSTLDRIGREWLQSKSVAQLIMNGAIQRFWPQMLLVYKNSPIAFTDHLKPEEGLTPVFKDNPRYWIFAYPVMKLPRFAARAWVTAVRAVNVLDKILGYPLLEWGIAGPQSPENDKVSPSRERAAAGRE